MSEPTMFTPGGNPTCPKCGNWYVLGQKDSHPCTTDRDDLAAIGQQIITDYALDHESLHANWRCEHPDVYGPCGCVDEFLTSLAQMVLESDWLRDVKADVWDARGQVEHATWCIYGDPDQGRTCPADNPYRADRVDAEDGGR